MGLLRLLVTGAAVAAGVHYVTKKRPDGSSIAGDLKAKAPEWKNRAQPFIDKAQPYIDKAQPYIDQAKEQLSKITGQQGGTNNGAYPNKFDNSVSDSNPTYSS